MMNRNLLKKMQVTSIKLNNVVCDMANYLDVHMDADENEQTLYDLFCLIDDANKQMISLIEISFLSINFNGNKI